MLHAGIGGVPGGNSIGVGPGTGKAGAGMPEEGRDYQRADGQG